MPPRRQAKQRAVCGVGWRLFIVVMVVGLSMYALGPLIYWNLGNRADGFSLLLRRASACPACSCDCLGDLAAITTPLSAKTLFLGLLMTTRLSLGNISLADCLKEDFGDLGTDDKEEIQQLTNELRLQQTVSEENQNRSQLAFLEAKRLSSQYLKEAEKCSTGMEMSEKTRAKAEAHLEAGRRMTALWEARARAMGWKDNKEGPYRIPVDDPFEEDYSTTLGRKDSGGKESVGVRRLKSWRPKR